RDLAIQREPDLDDRRDRRAVGNRERPRMPEAHRAHVRVRRRPELVEAAAEHLRLRGQFDVTFEPDHGLPGRHGALAYDRPRKRAPQIVASRGGRRSSASSVSSACAARNNMDSSRTGAVSWRPIGSPRASRPHGTLMAGTPPRLAGIVKMSFRY